jgi:hypothetical protein
MECPTNRFKRADRFSRIVISPGIAAFNKILTYIQACNHEQNIDKKVQILRFINSMLPNEIQIRIPLLITDDYVESALYNLEMACKGLTKLKKLFSLCIMNMFKTTRLEEMLGKRQRTFFWLNLHIHAT